MSTATLSPAAGDFGDWDDLLKFAAATRHLEFDLPAEGPVREHRPARGAAERAAIAKSLREDR